MTVFIICLVFFAAGSLMDMISSLSFEKYGMREINPLFRDKNGMFAEKRALLVFVGLLAVQIVVQILAAPTVSQFVNFLFLGIGAIRALTAVVNWRKRGELFDRMQRDNKN